MAIRDVYKQIEADREEEEWKSMGIDLLKNLAETEMGKKVNAFQQRELMQKSNINYKTAVTNSAHIKGERDKAYDHENGVVDYYVTKFTPMVKEEIARKYEEETFDEDRYAQLVRTEALRLAREQKDLLDKAYSATLNLRGSDSYDGFVKVNDGYNQTLGGALGARIRRGFIGESRESLDSKAEKAIVNSSYSRNAAAVNDALAAYNRGFTWAESTKIAGIKELKRQNEKIIGMEGEPQLRTFKTGGGREVSVMVGTEKYIDIHGVTRTRPVYFDEKEGDWARGEQGTTKPEDTKQVGFGGATSTVTADVTRDRWGNRIDVTPVGTPNNDPPPMSELAPHLRAFENTNTKSQDGERLSAKLALRDAFQNTRVRGNDTQTLADIGYESILGVNGVLVDTADVAADVQKKELTDAQSIVAALKRQVLANYYDTDAERVENEDFANKLAAQMFTNVGNALLTEGTAAGLFGTNMLGTDTHFFDFERGTVRYDDLKALDVLDAIGTRQGSSPLITGGKDSVNDFLNLLNSRTNILEEFNGRSPQMRQYYLDKFKDEIKFSFMHVSHSGRGKVYDILVQIDERQTAKGL